METTANLEGTQEVLGPPSTRPAVQNMLVDLLTHAAKQQKGDAEAGLHSAVLHNVKFSMYKGYHDVPLQHLLSTASYLREHHFHCCGLSGFSEYTCSTKQAQDKACSH